MKRKTVLILGILATVMVLGAGIALAQNTDGTKKNAEDNECSIEMMEDQPENCPEEMMQSGECGNMMDGAKDCSVMMGESSPSENTEAQDGEHCGDMGSDTGSMMGSKGADLKSMM